MMRSSYIAAIEGEVIITYNNGEVIKLDNIIDFTIDTDTEILEQITLRGEGLLLGVKRETFNVKITCGKLESTQPSKIKGKSLRRKIR